MRAAGQHGDWCKPFWLTGCEIRDPCVSSIGIKQCLVYTYLAVSHMSAYEVSLVIGVFLSQCQMVEV